MAPQQLLYLKSLHSVHIGLTCPNLHPDTLTTTALCRVSTWRKCLPRPTGFICCWVPLGAAGFYLLLGASASHPCLVLRPAVQGTGLWVHMVGAQPIRPRSAPQPLAHLRPSLWDTHQQPQTHNRHWAISTGATVRISPFPHLIPALTPPTHSLPHTFSLTQSITHMQTSALIHSNTHS